MSNLDRLEELWLRLGQEIQEDRKYLQAILSELKAKHEKFQALDEARRVILQDADTSDAGAKLLLDRLEEDPLASMPTQVSLHDSVVRMVNDSRSADGVSAMEVARVLHKHGYGSNTTWKNFYTYVTTSLNRWVKRRAITKTVPVGPGRSAARFIRLDQEARAKVPDRKEGAGESLVDMPPLAKPDEPSAS